MDSRRTALPTTVAQTLETLSIHIHTGSRPCLRKIAQSAPAGVPQPGPARLDAYKLEGKNGKGRSRGRVFHFERI
jgi:hypothetical protein